MKDFPVTQAQIALCAIVAICAGAIISIPFFLIGDPIAAVSIGIIAAVAIAIQWPPRVW